MTTQIKDLQKKSKPNFNPVGVKKSEIKLMV